MSKHGKPRHRHAGRALGTTGRDSSGLQIVSSVPAATLRRPFFQSPIEDVRYFRREIGRTVIPPWFPLWFAAIGVLFFLSMLSELRLTAGLALRGVLFAGAGWSLRHQRKLGVAHSQVSILFTIVLIVVVLFVGLTIGGSIMSLADWVDNG